ncbi:nitrate reductase molybdenum cofactor assembly chaperone [Cryobacterium frigoriphilum]|uniref:Nitrate reductase molybdenum cofactor assembly chaperone n=1 Tax=Cryobacterium frigoriphilum TaxID=1259150 RepID=A0A4R8ZUX6_9MICO|nr:nitrate reductase molybdenum cofactor assembly chaperone [Cryobacterium frigoriphilum]TFD46551.1 nitrate reductase molybdenum cofactor assembly chaperone [Cryobacterium frigoriphilum]
MMRDRVVYQAAGWCLSYPDAELLGRVALMRAALAEQGRKAPKLEGFFGYLEAADVGTLQRRYVETFDLSKHHPLYLSYWTDGDTRRRGDVLAAFKQVYRQTDFLTNTHGELPDFLPLVLEFAAIADPVAGRELLRQYRPSLELLRLALVEHGSPYGEVVAGVCATLPGASPADREAVQRMAGYGPPTETVGLEPYDPRLLPLKGA